MPELAEVETVRRVLINWVKGKNIRNIKCFYPLILENTNELEMNNCLKNKKIEDIKRHGKFLIFYIEDYCLVSHLRMEGKYFYYTSYTHSKHDHVVFELNDNSVLTYNDTRKFGKMNLVKKDCLEEFLKDIGPEPYKTSKEYLYKVATSYKGNMKEFLMDQHVMAGLGNIYCDEVLFDLNINPLRKAKTLSIDECQNIIDSSIKILDKAIKLGGSSVHSFSSGNGVDGRFQNELNAYGRENKECIRCHHPLSKMTINSRSTVFCPYCFNDKYKKPKVIGVTGLISSGKTYVSNLISNYGYKYINCDEISNNAYNDENVKKVLIDTFKTCEKSSIRDIVKSNPTKLKMLENIIHPYVINYIKNNIKDNIIIEAPLLFETKLDKLCDFVVMVVCDDKVRIERLKKRNKNYRDYLNLNNDIEESYKKVRQSSYAINTTFGGKDVEEQVERLFNKFINN